jgi:hypothetical protein
MRKPPRVKVGDIVALEWSDIISYGRVDGGDDSELPVAVFVSYGQVSYSDNDRVIILHELEIPPDGRSPTREPTVYPWGCVRKLTRLRPA